MTSRIRFITLIAAISLPGCELPLKQGFTQKSRTLSWVEYEHKDRQKRAQHIDLLKRQTKRCSSKAQCAEINYQIAILYLNSKNVDNEELQLAATHLNIAVQAGKYRQQAGVLYKVLLGWINETGESNELRKTLARTKAIDLEKRSPALISE